MDNRTRQPSLPPPMFCHIDNRDYVHFTLFGEKRLHSWEREQMVKYTKGHVWNRSQYLHTHVAARLQVETKMNLAICALACKVPTMLWSILELNLVSFEVWKRAVRTNTFYIFKRWSYYSHQGFVLKYFWQSIQTILCSSISCCSQWE